MSKQLKQTNIFEKVFFDKEGRLVRATFEVYENNGKLKARLLNFVYETAAAISGSILKLANFVKNKTSKFLNDLSIALSPSPYTLSPILITGSKPRAPTF